MLSRSLVRCVLLLVCLGFITACAHTGSRKEPTAIMTTEAFNFFNGEYENTPLMRKRPPTSVAVAPFLKADPSAWSIEMDNENPAAIVRKGMYNHVSSLPFKDLEIYDTDLRLKNAGLDTPEKVNELLQTDPEKLRSILGVDGLVTGEITHFDRLFAGIFSQIAVGCEVRMWDLSSGELLWRAKNVSRATAGGVSLTPIGLAMSAVASLWNLREEAMLEQNDNLFREIVSSIELPESVLATRQKLPRIDLFTCMNADHPFTAGQSVSFRLIGDPGARAYVDLESFQSGIELSPVSAAVKAALWDDILEEIKNQYVETGHELTPELVAAIEKELANREIYEGTYVVGPDRQAYGLMPKGYLVSTAGTQATRLDPVHLVDIDSKPPEIPAGFAVSPLNGKIELNWTRSDEPDIISYEIWTSDTPKSGFVLLGKEEDNRYMLQDRANFDPVYIKITAVDKAGNRGDSTQPVKAVALPHPLLYSFAQPGPVLGGTIQESILLRAAKGPFVVEKDLVIGPVGALYAEPGTTLLFRPDTGLTVNKGGLFLYGQADNPVVLTPETPTAPSGSYKGVAMNDVPGGVLAHVRINKAATGLKLIKASPSVSHTEITASSQAGIDLGNGAGPEMTGCFVHANEGMGGLLIAGEGVAPKIHGNIFENNTPFQVQSFVPVQIDLRNNFWGSPEPSPDLFLGEGLLIDPVLPERP
ncbi:GNA1162 family protein [Desulfoplanes sp.]